MTQSPVKQFVSLFGGMLLLAIPLSALTWCRERQRLPVKETEPISRQNKMLNCQLEFFSTTGLKDLTFFVNDQLVGELTELKAHEWGEMNISIPEFSLTNSHFSIQAKRTSASTDKEAVQLIFIPEGQEKRDETFWISGSLNRHFNF